MARLYANENFSFPVVLRLRELGHDILTTNDVGASNQRVPDDQVLEFAISQRRAVVTHNRDDFCRLHRKNPAHAGIIVCSHQGFEQLALAIHAALADMGDLSGRLIRINRIGPPASADHG